MWTSDPLRPLDFVLDSKSPAGRPAGLVLRILVAGLSKGPYQPLPFRRSFLPSDPSDTHMQDYRAYFIGPSPILLGTGASFAKTTTKLSKKPRSFSKAPQLSFGVVIGSSPGSSVKSQGKTVRPAPYVTPQTLSSANFSCLRQHVIVLLFL